MLCQRLYDLQGLFSIINVKAQRTQIVIAKAACNMLLDEESRFVAIQAKAITVLTIVATLDIPIAIEIVSQILISLAEDQKTCSALSKEPIVGIITLFLTNCTVWNFECAIQAAATYATVPFFRASMIEKDIVSVFLNSCLKGKIVDEYSSQAAAACLSFLTFVENGRERLVTYSHAILLLHAISHKNQMNVRLASMLSIIMRNLSFEPKVGAILIEQQAPSLLRKAIKSVDYNQSFILCQASLVFMQNIAKQKDYHDRLMEEGDLMEVLLLIASAVSSDSEDRDRKFSLFKLFNI
jgi:hypothetical protein